MSARSAAPHRQPLTERVRQLLRGHHRTLPVLTERQALAQLRPHGQGVMWQPITSPLNTNGPADGNPGGPLDERMFEDANFIG